MPRAFIHRSTFFAFILFLIFLPNIGSAQQLVYKFKQFTTNEGLPSSEVHQVLRDSRNFMWFATDHGVCRYDGYKFETFNLPDNSILSIYEDVKKRIWVASFSGQLFYYENGKFFSYRYNDVLINKIEQTAINRFYVDSSDNVYISTTAPNCLLINAQGEVKQLFHPNKDLRVEVFQIDNEKYFTYISGYMICNGVIYFANSNALSFVTIKTKYNEFKFRFSKIIQGRKCGAKKLKNNDIVFFSGDYLFRVSPKGNYAVKKLENNILDVDESDDEELLVATIQNGLYLLNKNNEIILNYFRGLTISGIEKDYERGLWVSTTQAGVFYLNSEQLKHLSEKQVIINQKILCLDVDKNSGIWAGGESGTALYFKRGEKLNKYDFPVVSINSINTDTKPDQVLICAGDFNNKDINKFLAYRIKGVNFILVQGISDVINFRGEIYSGKSGGIFKLNFSQKKSEVQNKDFFRVSELFLDSKNNILVGNILGLWKFSGNKLQPYDSTKPIFSSRITDINEYKNSNLLLGTRGKGFLVLAKDSLYQITSSDGLTSDNIRKIYVDKNVIWLATNRGISRLTVQSLAPFKYSIRNISVQDGLLSNEVNDIKQLDSNIIVATNGGISVFSQHIFDNSRKIPLSFYVIGVKINGVDTTINDHYFLNYKKRNLSLSFVALSYRESSNLEYRYRLFGIDSNWVYTNSKEIQLNPLPYGSYTIEIQARRQGEEWIKGNSLSIAVNRILPFWKTTWFIVICFLLAAFMMMLFFINRTRKIKQRERERTFLNKKLAEMELKALRAQMNPHFIFNVLNSIQYYIVHNENEEAQHYMSKFAKLVRLTLDNSRSTFISLKDELSLLRLYIDLEKIRFEDRFDYRIIVGNDIDLNVVKIPNMLLQPFVENSIKHGFKNKEVKYFLDISVGRREKNIICTINDNGIGRVKAALIDNAEKDNHASTGTIIIKEKIEALKQYYKYDLSTETEDLKDAGGNAIGTKIILTFPEKFNITDIT